MSGVVRLLEEQEDDVSERTYCSGRRIQHTPTMEQIREHINKN